MYRSIEINRNEVKKVVNYFNKLRRTPNEVFKSRALRNHESIGNELSEAVKVSDYAKVEILLKKGHDPNENIIGLMTPLAIAATNNDLKMAKLLLENGADPNSKIIYKPTKKQNDDFYLTNFKIKEDKLDALKERMKKMGFDLEKPDLWNNPVILVAIENKNECMVNLLLENTASPSQLLKNIFTKEPLFEAVKSGNVNVVKSLLDKGADPNAPFDSKVIASINKGNKDILKLLIDKGASTYYREDNAYNPISVALGRYDDACLDIVLAKCREDLAKVRVKMAEKIAEIKTKESELTEGNDLSKKLKRKVLKRAKVDFYVLKDRYDQYKDILTYASAIALSERRFSDRIIKVVAARDDIDLSKVSDKDKNELLRKEMDNLYDKYYFKTPFRKPYEHMEFEKEDYLLDPEPPLKHKKYDVVDTIKKFTYLEKPYMDRERVSNQLKKLNDYNDIYISTFLTCVALDAFNSKFERAPARLFVAKSESGSITPLIYDANPKGVVLGRTDLNQGKIFFSRILRESESSRVLIHEATHAMCKIVKDGLSKEEYDTMYSELAKSVGVLKNSVKEAEIKNPEVFSNKEHTTPEQYAKQCIGRVEKASSTYFFEAYANEDVLCDMMAGRQYVMRHPERAGRANELMEPMFKFADKYLMPKLLEYILKHQNLNRVILPSVVKSKLVEMHKTECLNKGITLSNLERVSIRNHRGKAELSINR